MSYCMKCGAALPADAQFCPRCGTAVAAQVPHVAAAAPVTPQPADPMPAPPVPPQRVPVPPPSAAPPPPRARAASTSAPRSGAGAWWIAPAVVVGLVLIAWLVVSFMPFGGREETRPRETTAATETIAEGPSAQGSATIIDTPGSATDTFALPTTTTVEPPMTTTPTVPSTGTAAAQAPPVVVPQPQPQTPPRTQPVTPAASPPVQRAEISPADATSTLQSYVRSTRYYGVANECVRVENRGYRNAGYNLEVWHSCPGSSGGARLLGRWRVDSKTREVFRQREDGRYRRP